MPYDATDKFTVVEKQRYPHRRCCMKRKASSFRYQEAFESECGTRVSGDTQPPRALGLCKSKTPKLVTCIHLPIDS